MPIGKLFAVMLLILSLSVTLASANDDHARALYGKGVHAFFAGYYPQANEMLTRSIAMHSVDPRPYFFRGVVSFAMGDSANADLDFEMGARAETTPAGHAFGVDDALERIQGPMRMEIEKHRRNALVNAQMSRGRPFNSLPADREMVAPGLETSQNAVKLPDASTIVDATIPFPDTSAKAYFPPTKSAASARSAAPSTIVPSAKPAEQPAAEDPFGGQKKSGESQPKSNDDPFGG